MMNNQWTNSVNSDKDRCLKAAITVNSNKKQI